MCHVSPCGLSCLWLLYRRCEDALRLTGDINPRAAGVSCSGALWLAWMCTDTKLLTVQCPSSLPSPALFTAVKPTRPTLKYTYQKPVCNAWEILKRGRCISKWLSLVPGRIMPKESFEIKQFPPSNLFPGPGCPARRRTLPPSADGLFCWPGLAPVCLALRALTHKPAMQIATKCTRVVVVKWILMQIGELNLQYCSSTQKIPSKMLTVSRCATRINPLPV